MLITYNADDVVNSSPFDGAAIPAASATTTSPKQVFEDVDEFLLLD